MEHRRVTHDLGRLRGSEPKAIPSPRQQTAGDLFRRAASRSRGQCASSHPFRSSSGSDFSPVRSVSDPSGYERTDAQGQMVGVR